MRIRVLHVQPGWRNLRQGIAAKSPQPSVSMCEGGEDLQRKARPEREGSTHFEIASRLHTYIASARNDGLSEDAAKMSC